MKQRAKLGTTLLSALALLALACSESQGEPATPASGAATEGIPSRAEALQRAADEIDAENADEELERLKREMAGDA